MSPFAHWLVLDLAQDRAGSYCTRLFAGFGARVVKVEPPAGDPMRSCGPFAGNVPDIERSLPFHWLNAGKESITVDPQTREGRDILAALVRKAHVLVETRGAAALVRWGIDDDVLRKLNPRLIATFISNFGNSGPYRDYKADEAILYAMSGGMVATGDPDKPPLAPGPAIAQYTAALYAYIAILMAAWRQAESDQGEFIEVSVQECALQNVEYQLSHFSHEAKVARRNGDDHIFVPWRTYPCRDGLAAVIGGPVRHWHRTAAKLFEEPRLAAPDLLNMLDRHKRRREVEALLRPWLARNGRRDVYHKGQAVGLAFSYLASLAEAVDWPQHRARGFFVSAKSHPVLGRLRVCGSPVRLDSVEWRVGRAPLLGEHGASILKELHAGEDEPASKPADSPSRAAGQPLASVRVIDLGHGWAGPHGSRLLADFGAEVIKIEYFRRIDIMRGARKDNKAYDHHFGFRQFNRNKRSLALDLCDRRDLSVFEDLVCTADVVMSTSRPGVLERLGIPYQRLRELNPGIIFLAMSAHGEGGPESAYGQFGGGIEAISGIQNLTAYNANAEPRRIREIDVTNGIFGAAALLTALLERRRTGAGAMIELSEVEAATHAVAGEHFLEFTTNGRSSLPVGNRHPTHAPHGCYPCQGGDAWLVIAVSSEDEWKALCATTGHPEWLTDPRFANEEARRTHHDELDELIGSWTGERSKTAAMTILQRAGIPAGAVMNAADLFSDPHLAARGYFRRPSEAPSDPLFPGFPFRLSGGGGEVRRPGPNLGEANREVVCDWLKRPASDVRVFSDDEVHTEYDVD